MKQDFRQIAWDAETVDDCRQVIRLAVREELGCGLDLTTVALVPREAHGAADIVVRRRGVVAGLPAVQLVLDEMHLAAECDPLFPDGTEVDGGSTIARLQGVTRDLLTGERIILNLLGRLCGIATLTRQYVAAIQGTGARVYDTRKTTPGWRRLEKYAVRCGGGTNHRTGLFDAILIKDNHLAQAARATGTPLSPAEAVQRARHFLQQFFPRQEGDGIPVEIEVDTLEQFAAVLPLAPDIILLDNMLPDQLRIAVAQRNAAGVATELEASGGITLESIRSVAETGVERISSGALTHSATALDVALDWRV